MVLLQEVLLLLQGKMTWTPLFGSKSHIFDAKTDPFIPFGVNSFEYLEHIGIKIIEKLNDKIVSCV